MSESERLSLLCARVLSADCSLLEYSISRLSPQVFHLLLKCALERESYACLHLLLKHWPHNQLSLNDLCIVKALPTGHDYRRTAPALVHAFLRALEAGHVGHMKMLDLRSVIIVEPVLSYLSTHVLLAHNECKRLQVVQAVRQFEHIDTNVVSHSNRARVHEILAQADTTLPAHTDCSVLVDIRVNEFSPRLTDALHISKMDELGSPRLRLLINAITMTLFSEEHILHTLDALSEQHLTGLSLVASTLSAMPDISRFQALTSLDLNNCRPLEHSLIPSICATVKQLPHLQHLGLNSNRISNRLKCLLDACQVALVSLELPSCNLRALDLLHLASSKHMSSLHSLDLSDNELGTCIAEVCTVMRSCRPLLTHLMLDACRFRDEHLERLLINARLMPCLQQLSMADNDWFSCEHLSAVLLEQIISKADTHCIRAMRFSVPNQSLLAHTDTPDDNPVHTLATYDLQDNQRRVFVSRMEQCVQLKLTRPTPGLSLAWTDPTGAWPPGIMVEFPDL